MTDIWMNCVFVMKHMDILIKYLGKIGVGGGPRGPEILVATKKFGEGFFDGPVTDSESVEDYGVIVRIDGTDALSNCGAGNWVVGKPSGKSEGDSFGKEATVVGKGEAAISIGGELTEGGTNPRIGQAATEEATRKF
jgi:hypothetical protein